MFLGIENTSRRSDILKARAKNSLRKHGRRVGNATTRRSIAPSPRLLVVGG